MNKTEEKKYQTKKSLSGNQYETIENLKYTTREKSLTKTETLYGADNKPEKEQEYSCQTNPVNNSIKKEKPNLTIKPRMSEKQLKVKDKITRQTEKKTESEAEQVVNAVLMAKNSIVKELSANFEEKLEKLDDAILELISCKTENERLKAKIDNLTRENYRLKKENKSFKQVVPGFYVKTKPEEINL